MRRSVMILVLLFGALCLAFTLTGCGKKGEVVPAWTARKPKPPRAVRDLTAEVRYGRVWLTFTEPTENKDRSKPINLDRYVVFYEVMPLTKKFCLTCPLNLSRKLEFTPTDPGEVKFEGGRAEVPVGDYDSRMKYVFIVLAVSPEERSMGDSNTATLNWPEGQ